MDENEKFLAEMQARLEKSANIIHQIGAAASGFMNGGARLTPQQQADNQLNQSAHFLMQNGLLPGNQTVNIPAPHAAPGAMDSLRARFNAARQGFSNTRAADQAVDRFHQIQQGEAIARQHANVLMQHGHADPLHGQINYGAMTPAQYLEMHGHAVPAHHGGPSAPGAQGAGPAAPTQRMPAAAPAAATHVPAATPAAPPAATPAPHLNMANLPRHGAPPATSVRGNMPWKHLAMGGAAALAAGAGAAALWRSRRPADEQDARTQDYLTNAQYNMNTPLPPMAVYASYDEFANEKKADFQNSAYNTAHGAVANAVANQLAQRFIGDPLDDLSKHLKKKFYDEPKHEAAFQHAINSDEMLQEAHAQNPQAVRDTFNTLKAFAPSIAKNPGATRMFLRQSTMSGMNGMGPDFATIRLLAETEKFHQNAQGKGSPWS